MSQVAYLQGKLTGYRSKKNADRRRKFVSEVVSTLKQDYTDLTNQAMSRRQEKRLREVVERWFERYVSGSCVFHKKPWAVRWYARLVLQYDRTHTIMYIAKILALGKPEQLPDLRQLYDDEELVLPQEDAQVEEYVPDANEDKVDEEEEEDNDDSRGKGSSTRQAREKGGGVFSWYQRATMRLWNVLTQKEHDMYDRKAQEWRVQGPPLEERRRVAEKYLRSQCRDFALACFNDMNAHLFLLLGFEKMDGTAVSVEADFNSSLGACDQDFIRAHETRSRSSRWSVMRMFNQWMGEVLRSYFTRYIVIAHGKKLPPCTIPPEFPLRESVPWTCMKKMSVLRQCIKEEYLPDDLAEEWGDPGKMRVHVQKAYHSFFYSRQQDDTIETKFKFDFIPRRLVKGYEFVPFKEPDSDAEEEYANYTGM
ncbi:hypothetical protein CC2G_001321 [Coprinopsis cinerea AmutBmut pab1-1]|nr:hypothetical protein CC2G_001321 [Coprinopsis cinerea AmutBmut pab1-1]